MTTPSQQDLLAELRRVMGLVRMQNALMAVLVDRLGGDVTITTTDLDVPRYSNFETTPLGSYRIVSKLRLDNPDTPA